jgi:hypothetical protein
MRKLLIFLAFVSGVVGLVLVLLANASSDLRSLEVEPDFDDLDL